MSRCRDATDKEGMQLNVRRDEPLICNLGIDIALDLEKLRYAGWSVTVALFGELLRFACGFIGFHSVIQPDFFFICFYFDIRYMFCYKDVVA